MSDPSLSNPIYVPRLKTVVLSLAMKIDPWTKKQLKRYFQQSAFESEISNPIIISYLMY